MKKTALIALLAVAILAKPFTSTARADDDAKWAIAGFIGGVIAEKVVQNHKHNQPQYGHTETVIIQNSGHQHGSNCGCNTCRPAPAGYWTYETRQVWVPGCWETTYDSCGNRHQVWRQGYYRTERTKVWVSTERSRYNGHHNNYRGVHDNGYRRSHQEIACNRY